MLFQAFIIGFITNGGGGTLTSLYQSGCSQTRYWSFTKFLSRGKWDADAVAALMMKLLQQIGALGLLCQTATGWTLFPVWVKLMCPQKIRDKSKAVLQRIISKLVPGLIIFDRGFARRKVFTIALKYGHYILCRAKSNAVFYKIPKIPKKRKRGRPKDMTLDISQIVIHYRHRWQIETAFRDVKQNFGFDKYQVKSRKSINRFVQLNMVAFYLQPKQVLSEQH